MPNAETYCYGVFLCLYSTKNAVKSQIIPLDATLLQHIDLHDIFVFKSRRMQELTTI